MKTFTRARTPSALTALLTVVLLIVGGIGAPAFATGGDQGACPDGYWLKADWTGAGWSWETGPAWDADAPAFPALAVAEFDEDGDPWMVTWTSTVAVASVHVKAGLTTPTFDGGLSGTVTGGGVKEHAISHIVFCYGQQPQPEYGGLVVSKTVQGEAGDAVFTFEVGEETFPLADGENRPFSGLPAGTRITVTETATGGADATTVDGETGTSTTVTIEANETIEVEFVNTFDEDTTPPHDDPEPRPQPEPLPSPEPAISLVKEVDVEPNADGDRIVEFSGEPVVVTYTYRVTNTGDTTLTDLTLFDDVLGDIQLSDTSLEAGEELTATATTTITGAGPAEIVNVAIVTGTAPNGAEVTDSATQTVLVTEVQSEVLEPEESEESEEETPEPTEVLPATKQKEAVLAYTGAGIGFLVVLAGVLLLLGQGLIRSSAVERDSSRS